MQFKIFTRKVLPPTYKTTVHMIFVKLFNYSCTSSPSSTILPKIVPSTMKGREYCPFLNKCCREKVLVLWRELLEDVVLQLVCRTFLFQTSISWHCLYSSHLNHPNIRGCKMRQETTCLFLIALPALMVGNELINNNAFISIVPVQSASPMLMATSCGTWEFCLNPELFCS